MEAGLSSVRLGDANNAAAAAAAAVAAAAPLIKVNLISDQFTDLLHKTCCSTDCKYCSTDTSYHSTDKSYCSRDCVVLCYLFVCFCTDDFRFSFRCCEVTLCSVFQLLDCI